MDKSYAYLGGRTYLVKEKGASTADVQALQNSGVGDDYTPYVIYEMEWR